MEGTSRTSATATLGSDPGGRLVARRVRVRVVEGPDAGAEALLEEGRVHVGSGEGADLVLQDRGVSRMHVELALLPRGIRVVDLGSRNGTFVGGARIESVVVPVGTAVVVGRTRLVLEPADLAVETPISSRTRCGGLVGVSESMRRVFALIERVAPSALTVWIDGEPGTGKSAAALAVHEVSPRAGGRCVVLDASRPLTRGEVGRRFEEASGGTVVIENADGAPGWVATELIAALDRAERLEVDARAIATAGSRPAPGGEAAEELRARLGAVRVTLPPLRERREDVGLLLGELATKTLGADIAIDDADVAALHGHAFPGNLHDLRRLVELAAAEHPATADAAATVPGLLAGAWASDSDALATLPFKEAKTRLVDAFERHYVRELLDRHGGDLVRAAREAGVVRHHLAALARKHGLIE